MTEQITQNTDENIVQKYPQWFLPDERLGYEGFLVEREQLLEVAQVLRDEYGYDYLTSVTGVDYLAQEKMEVVYHFFKSIGGSAFELKVQSPRDDAVVPSLTSLYPGTEFQEREAWDLLGIKFSGHPDLRRIMLWEGFVGHPLRKDWKETYYEDQVKPFKSRWPEGKAVRSETNNPYHANVQYPKNFDPDIYAPDNDESVYQLLRKVQEKYDPDIQTDQVIINFGPQHPSTHGVFRMVTLLEGETIIDIKPVLGYLHRNHEKIGERNTFIQNIPFTDRLDYITSMSNNFGYVLTIEKLMGIKPPERAMYIRTMMAELTRIASHIVSVGFLLNDLGAFFTPMLYAMEERELILDIFEAVSGSRMMCNYYRFGGVARDLPEGVFEKIRTLVNDRLPRKIDEIDRYLTKNEVIRLRCEGVGILTPEDAINNAASGPVLRGSGVPYDIRRADPYEIYDRFEFDVAYGTHGDLYDRYLVRLEEMRQSLRILQQIIRDIPDGEIQTGKPAYQVRVPAGEAYGRIESPKGELGFYVVSDGKPNPYRYHIRSGSFVNLTSLAPMARGSKIADAVTILGSIDIVLGEVDR